MTPREAILKIVESKFKVTNARLCTVQAVNLEARTCDVVTFDTQADLLGVRLQADAGKGMLLVPKIDSMVVVVEVARFEYAVVLFSDVDSIQLLDGSYGGLVKVNELVKRLNEIEQTVNDLISAHNKHVHSANNTVTVSIVGKTLGKTTASQIENELVKHGNV